MLTQRLKLRGSVSAANEPVGAESFRHWVVLLCLGGALFSLAILPRVRELWVFTVDDTFITLRYAKHLAQGLGPAWNAGGPAVEGYTTVLWMLLLALPHLLGADAVFWAKAASVACAVGCAVASSALALGLTRALDQRSRGIAAAIALAVSAAYWPLPLHAVSGMETTAFALLLTLHFSALLAFIDRPSARLARVLASTALLATLTRPEGALVCGVSLVALALQTASAARGVLARSVALWTIAPGAAYFALRFAVYGLPLPLPFYVKATGQGGFAGSEDVALFFAPFVVEQPHIAALAIIAIARFGKRALPVLLGALALAIFFLFPAHVMGFSGRYLFPIFPLIAALVGAGTGSVSAFLRERITMFPRTIAWLPVAALLAALAALPLPRAQTEEAQRWVRYGRGLNRAHVTLGRELARLGSPTERRSIALLDVGAVGYFGEWWTVDTFGLNDVRVAMSKRTDVAYVLDQQPELLVLVSAEKGSYVPVFDWEPALYELAIARGYRFACDYEFLSDYHLHVLARAQSQVAPRLSCATPSRARDLTH